MTDNYRRAQRVIKRCNLVGQTYSSVAFIGKSNTGIRNNDAVSAQHIQLKVAPDIVVRECVVAQHMAVKGIHVCCRHA